MGLEQMIDKEMKKSKVRILTIDIETSPIVAYTWGPKYETNLIEVLDQGQIISFSAKWLDGKQVTMALPDYKGYRPNKLDDKRIVKDIHKLLDAADIVVTQNGIDFDIRYINSRFLNYGISPPSPYKQVDTKKEARKITKMPSHSLDDMGKYFKLGHKLEHEGFDLWKKCIAGDKQAWDKMKKYNAQDVRLTEQIYLKLRPFMKSHPNVSLYSELTACPKCDSENVHKQGYHVLTSGRYQKYQCQDCGSWYKAGKPEPLANKRTKGTSI